MSNRVDFTFGLMGNFNYEDYCNKDSETLTALIKPNENGYIIFTKNDDVEWWVKSLGLFDCDNLWKEVLVNNKPYPFANCYQFKLQELFN